MRHIDKPVKLSDGTVIPSGVTIHTPYGLIVEDEELYDDPHVSNPLLLAFCNEAHLCLRRSTPAGSWTSATRRCRTP